MSDDPLKRGRGRPPKSATTIYRPTAEAILAEIERRKACAFYHIFQDEGPLRRALYTKHTAFMAAGSRFQQRAFLAGNRSGKTWVAAYEVTCHLTGAYPDWWRGRRFETPTDWWLAGDTGVTTRDILQVALLGPTSCIESRAWAGMIPRTMVYDISRKPGVPMAVSTIWVKHATGAISSVELKCHPGHSRVLMSDGSWARIDAIRLNDWVRCPDGEPRKVSQLHAYRDAPTVRVITRAGTLEATKNHPCHTENRGWVNAGDLIVGDVLTESYHKTDGQEEVEPWRVILMALMIGDGCTRGKTPFFTCNEPPIIEMVRDILPRDLEIVRIRRTISYKISSRLWRDNRLSAQLRADHLWRVKSKHKFIPPWVFRLPRKQRIVFLRWLWTCDGTVNPKAASYSTASKRLAEDVRLLLWSVGIRVPVVERLVSNQSGKRFQSYALTLYGENRQAFDEIGKLNRNVPAKVTPRPKPTGEIVAIEEAGRQDVFCVGVDDVHELIVEGYRVGNSYDQKRESFQGTEKHGIWLDEECPEDIYGECLMRTMTSNGLVLVTFTPLQGLTPFIASWLERATMEVLDAEGHSLLVPAKAEVFKGITASEIPDVDGIAAAAVPTEEKPGSRYLVMATWDDAPHLTAEMKDAMLKEYPPHQRDARSKGIPALGSGLIWPVPEADITIAPFAIPEHWPRAFGMDIDAGAGWTAAAWMAWDRETGVYYLYDVYKRSHAEPVVHATAIKSRGAWIPGVADAAALLVTQHDAEQYVTLYKRLGLDVTLPDKSVETGLQEVWELFSAGRLKVFANCQAFFEEFRLYRRDEKGRVVKRADHLCDCVRYLVRSGRARMKTRPGSETPDPLRMGRSRYEMGDRSQSWMQ